MGDDLTTSGVLPGDEVSGGGDDDFDPDAILSDDLLDDFVDEDLGGEDAEGDEDDDEVIDAFNEE